MKKESIFTGKTVDEALKLGLAELELKEENVEWEVIEAEKKGILGIGATPAKIKIVYNEKSITDKTCSEYKLYYNSYGVCEIPDYNTGAP